MKNIIAVTICALLISCKSVTDGDPKNSALDVSVLIVHEMIGWHALLYVNDGKTPLYDGQLPALESNSTAGASVYMNVKTQDDRFDIIFIIGSTLYHKNFDLRNGKYIGIECLDENFIYFSQWKNKIMLPD